MPEDLRPAASTAVAASSADAVPKASALKATTALTTMAQSLAIVFDGRLTLDKKYFTNFSAFTEHYQQHNAALKWFREVSEDPTFPFDSPSIEAPSGHAPCVVGSVVHGSGTDFDFDHIATREWYWVELVAQLDTTSRDIVFGESDELVACSCAVRPSSYDHKRQAHHRSRGEPKPKLPIWDFVIHRADGTRIRLNPHWSDAKVDAFHSDGFEQDVQKPKKGLGAADFKGHFKAYQHMMNDGSVLRFDGARRPRGPTFYVGKQKRNTKVKAEATTLNL